MHPRPAAGVVKDMADIGHVPFPQLRGLFLQKEHLPLAGPRNLPTFPMARLAHVLALVMRSPELDRADAHT